MKSNSESQKLVAKRFFKWQKESGESLLEIAPKFGVSSQALTNWKTRGIPSDKFGICAEIMRIPLDVLVAKEGDLEVATGKIRMLPIISSVHASNWTGIGDMTFGEYMPVTVNCSADSFCLKVEGPSMLPVFVEGDVVTVDPAIAPTGGRYVVAKRSNEEEATIKKYRALGLDEQGNDVFELVPTNPDFASYRSDKTEIKIIGVVISVSRPI